MERQLKLFFSFLENDKKLSDNTLQSYKRDLKQFRQYLEACEIHYNRVKEEDINEYIREMQEEGKKSIKYIKMYSINKIFLSICIKK